MQQQQFSPILMRCCVLLLQVVQDLINRALSAPLLPAQQQAVLTQLEADPKLVHYIGVHASWCSLLVQLALNIMHGAGSRC
jgi:hypothetical protein